MATPLPPPILVHQPDQVPILVADLSRQSRIAVDTESNSLFAYRERVCLIQFSTLSSDYLVDPLSLRDLAALAPVFSDASLEKVFHAAEYDLICLQRDFGFRCENLFDTRVACRTLGRDQDGLGDLLQEEFGVRMNKRLQRANWGQRPLPDDLLDYARLDTRYLLPLRDRLAEALQRAGRWQEASEECVRLARLEVHTNGFDPGGFWRITNARRLSPAQVGALRRLYLLREELARRADRPPFKILGDRTLTSIAQALPTRLEDLKGLPGMTPGQIARYGARLVEAVEQGRHEPLPRPPAAERLDEAALARHELLRTWRKKTAAARGVESDVILPKDVLWTIAQTGPRSPEQLWAVMEPLEWRFRAYGPEILKVLDEGLGRSPRRRRP